MMILRVTQMACEWNDCVKFEGCWLYCSIYLTRHHSSLYVRPRYIITIPSISHSLKPTQSRPTILCIAVASGRSKRGRLAKMDV
jgi:hypothetical protein